MLPAAHPSCLLSGMRCSCWHQPACWVVFRGKRRWRGSRSRKLTSCSTTPSLLLKSSKTSITSSWNKTILVVFSTGWMLKLCSTLWSFTLFIFLPPCPHLHVICPSSFVQMNLKFYSFVIIFALKRKTEVASVSFSISGLLHF